jgi:hypothetical protein
MSQVTDIVGTSPVKDPPLVGMLRSLDDLLAEARRVSDEIRAMLDRPAFWPERRRVNEAHVPDRRVKRS